MSTHYELFFILDSNQNDDEVSTVSGRIKDIINNHEGVVIKEENWGVRTLAYEINKQPKGRYILFFFSALPTVVVALEKNFNVMENVLKYMTIKLNKHQLEAYQKKAAKEEADKIAAEAAKKAEAEAETAPEAETETPAAPESTPEAAPESASATPESSPVEE